MEAFIEMIMKFIEVTGNSANIDLREWIPETDVYTVILIAALFMIIGVLQCFLGFKSFKVWCSFIGLVVGAVLGTFFVLALNLYESEFANLISIFFVVCLGLIGAFVAYRAYLVGVFVYAFISLFTLSYVPLSTMVEPVMIAIIVGVCTGIAAGVVAVIIQRFSIIVATCLSGGLSIAVGMMMLFEGASPFVAVILPAIAGLLCAGGGFFVQLATTKEKPKEVTTPVPVVNVSVQGAGATVVETATSATTPEPTPEATPEATTEVQAAETTEAPTEPETAPAPDSEAPAASPETPAE